MSAHRIFVIIPAVVLLMGPSAQEETEVFRAASDLVLVPVWVKDGKRPVSGLTASAFRLSDNGIAQDVSIAAERAGEVDVTLVVDTSGSVRGDSLLAIKTGVQQIAQSLGVRDRVRLVTFSATARDVSGFGVGGVPLPLQDLRGGGDTAFYDAVALALMSTPLNNRPQLLFAVSDGLDTISFLNAKQLESIAVSSPASLYVAILRTRAERAVRDVWAERADRPSVAQLRQAATRSGGLLYEHPQGTALPGIFAEALEDFRTSYLLSYVPKGVRGDGWHELTVSTDAPRYTVRARAGYQQ